MARRASKPCSNRSCAGLVRDGVCSSCGPLRRARCGQREYDKQRGSAARRGYGSRWRKLRNMKLSVNPLCEECLQYGLTTAATEVDHIVAKRQGGKDEWENLRSLCKPCHSRKTAMENTGRGRRVGG